MESLFAESHGTLEQINTLFIQLERHVGHPDEVQIEDTIHKKLEDLNKVFERVEVYVMKEPPARRQGSRLKLNQMKYDATHLNASLKTFQRRRYARDREHTEREDLLNRRFTTNSSEDTSISMDYSLQHNTRLENANRGLDDMLDQGHNILGNLRDQRETLKRTRTKMLNFLSTLGLSNSVMNLIERRAYQDKFVLYGGMLVTISVMFLIYMYFI